METQLMNRSVENAEDAIKHALRALRTRHSLEEGAHAPAYKALSKPLVIQGSEWREKAESLELELQQCYKAQSRLSEQLVLEIAESRSSKALLLEKDDVINDLRGELKQLRDNYTRLEADLNEKNEALELAIGENRELRSQLEKMTVRAKETETENKALLDRWMLQKMHDAEHLNEANAFYEELAVHSKSGSLGKLALQQADGVIRRGEDGASVLVKPALPTSFAHQITTAHPGGCTSMLFEHNSGNLLTGGQDRAVKVWDANTGSLSLSLQGCLGMILDLSVTHDNRHVIAASTSNNLYVWDAGSGRIRHTLTGHMEKVCAVDVSKISSRIIASSSYDRTIKTWDLGKGFCTNTVVFHSNCNALCFSSDGQTVFSGHVDGNLRLWDVESGKLVNEVAAHLLAITSLSISKHGNLILTSGRDNLHNLFDFRTLEACCTLRATGTRVASNWSRSCLSPDDNFVASGSADGSVYIWSTSKAQVLTTLKEHKSPVLCCSWSGLGTPLASADKNGSVVLWS